MINRRLGAGALAVCMGSVLLPAAAAAQQPSLEQRLRELESAYTELLVRDGEKTRELERLRGEVSGLRQGKRDAGAAAGSGSGDDHGHAHGEPGKAGAAKDAGRDRGRGHDRGHGHDHAGEAEHDQAQSGSDVLLESGGARLYVPSVGLDFVGYRDDSSQDLDARLGGLRGFGHAHGGGEEEEHEHTQLQDGFNLRHAEVGFVAEAVGYGRAQVLLNGSTDGVELEEAFLQSDPIGGIAAFKGGKFRSAFGYFNQYHSPEWKFADAPLAHFLLLGDHGLEGTGVQAVLTPPGLPVSVGLELFQGGGETVFSRNDAAGKVEEPSVFVGWLKGKAFEKGANRLDLGFSGGLGRHQEVHEEEDEQEKLKGDAWFLSPGFTFVRRGDGPHGAGTVTVKGEYIYRVKDLSNVDNGEPLESTQDGYYLEAAYGFAPRFEAGLRWEQVGLINETTEGDATDSFGRSWRVGGFFAFQPVRFTRVGMQAAYGSYDFSDGRDEVFQALGRAVFQFGPHFH
jgi:hypothetical protein